MNNVSAEHEHPATYVARPGLRLSLQIVMLAIAVPVFLWLVNIVMSHPGGITGGTVEGWLGFTPWVVLLLVLLFILLALVVLWMDSVYGAIFGYEIVNDLSEVDHAHPADAVTIGCPACGTVFELEVASLTDGEFACHNCGREGVIRDHSLNKKAIQAESCTTCGHEYLEYQEFSECPSCHTFNEY